MRTNSFFFSAFCKPDARRRMINILILLSLIGSTSFAGDNKGNVARALIIGIDIYKPVSANSDRSARTVWKNLSGCVNDANAIKNLVVARNIIGENNITTLFNQEATREKIIASIQHLISVSMKDDVVLIYYAGHGSQVVNSLSVESDLKDETIVPADSFKGAADIRDKELAVLFNQLLDKGVVLTVIFDSCHSGSVARGNLFKEAGVRYMEGNPLDVKDPSDPPKPEERGALILSAAQDFEYAKEITDENNNVHGAFTLSLLKSLQQNPIDAPAENIFAGIQAILKFYGKTQEPVLAGSTERKKGSLFGLKKGTAEYGLRIPVLKSTGDRIELMGGTALGLAAGQTLRSLHSGDTIMIMETFGANRSIAKRVSRIGSDIAPGNLFEIISWTSGSGLPLRIYIPENVLDDKQLEETLSILKTMKARSVKLVSDPSADLQSRIVHYGEKNWWYSDENSGKRIENPSLQKLIGSHNQSMFINLPPSQNLVKNLKEQFAAHDNIEIVNDPALALYSLVGRMNGKNGAEYGFLRNDFASGEDNNILPLRTDFIPFDRGTKNENAEEKLAEHVFRIAKIRNWMLLQSPPGISKFPFEMEVKYYRSGQSPANHGVQLGDTLSFFFTQIPSEEKWNRKKRYIYVFSIDAGGAMKLLFPQASRGNVENRFPRTDAYNSPEASSKLFDMLVKPPAGNDAYFLLSTEEAIANLSAFQQPGVVSRGPAHQASNSIEAVLYTGAKSRNRVNTPLTWSVSKIVLNSKEN